MTELKHKVWEHLELVAELNPLIAVMEDVIDKLGDPTDPPTPEDRLKILRKLAESLSPDSVCNLVRLVHSRRLVCQEHHYVKMNIPFISIKSCKLLLNAEHYDSAADVFPGPPLV